MSFTTCEITHTFTAPDGNPASGTVEFTLTKGITNASATIVPGSVIASLNAEGALSQNLVSTQDTNTEPVDARWRVDLRLTGKPLQTYFIQVPANAGPVDLGTLLPSEGDSVPFGITPQWQTYLDWARDVKPYLQVPLGKPTYDATLQAYTDAACTAIQNFCSRPFVPTQFSRYYSGYTGKDGDTIMLDYTPVVEIVSVTEWWGANGGHTLTRQTPEQQTNSAGGQVGDVYQIDYLRGRLTRTFPALIKRPWFPGEGNVEVSYIAGYNPLPADVRAATFELIAWWYRNSQEAVRFGKPTGAMEYDQPMPSALWPGWPDKVTDLLQPYVQQNMG